MPPQLLEEQLLIQYQVGVVQPKTVYQTVAPGGELIVPNGLTGSKLPQGTAAHVGVAWLRLWARQGLTPLAILLN
jgi:hypothetical protein